jgi:sn-glycerol 3-phosphate transport system ATP-binding protein/multiple sugar transport system ATP-binding protein
VADVRVVGIEKTFGETKVLKGVSVSVPEGGFCVLVGSSGCGKSTLLRCIAGLEEPTAGTIHIGQRDVTRLPPRDRDIAMVFQSYALYPHLTVAKNLAFGLELRKTPQADIDKRVAEVAELLGLTPLLSRLPKELSGGQRQRVAMGRAIARRPAVFLFDEPLSNLDAALRSQVRVQIRKLHDSLSATSVYVTHDQVEAMTLADVMVVLHQGRVEQSGAPLDVYRKPRTRFVAGFLGTPSMAFLAGELRDGTLALAGGGRIALPAYAGQAVGAVELGVRAEDLVLAEDGPLRGEVDVVEALGSETFAHVTGDFGTVIAKLPARAMVKRGDKISLVPEATGTHLFDAQTGLAVERREPS